MARIAAIVAASLVPLFAVASVFAHAEPVRVTPGDGAVLTRLPTEIVITMSQELARQAGANDIDVVDAAGNEVTVVAAIIDNGNRRILRVPMPPSLEPGLYTVRWKTLSDEDGDTDAGELSFEYDPQGAPSEGRVELRDDIAVPETTATMVAAPLPVTLQGDDGGLSWVLVAAVGTGAFVLGCGVTYVIVQKRP